MPLLRHAPFSRLALALSCIGVAGCATGFAPARNAVFEVTASTEHATTAQTVQMHALLNAGGGASVHWQVQGDTPEEDAGTITAGGLYTPPAFLSQETLHAEITATLASRPAVAATYTLTVNPAISITPENVALAPGAETVLYATLAETGGGALNWSVANAPGGGALARRYGRFSVATCQTSATQFTQCSVTYTAPDALPGGKQSLVYAQAADPSNPIAFTATRVLLNATTLATPLDNQMLQNGNAALGASGGNGNDTAGQYCCGGTLGSLLRMGSDSYILSNNHVLARSDDAALGEAITQPGLTDTQCGYDPSGTVARLSYAPRLRDDAVNVDAAVAKAEPGAVREDGAILGLGASSVAAAVAEAAPATDPEDITASGHTLPLLAKSGRSTGLTCAPVSALDVDLKVAYNTACDGSGNGFSKVFRGQVAVAGAAFSDTGDSGSLVVDQATAQPVGMLFAGNATETFLNPIQDVLDALQPFAATHGGAVSFAGGAHHAVSCLDYDALAAHKDVPAPLRAGEAERGAAALAAVNSGAAGLAVALPAEGHFSVESSRDDRGAAALVLHIPADRDAPALPASIDGVRTAIVFDGTLPGAKRNEDLGGISRALVDAAIAAKRRAAAALLADPAVLGIGVERSQDDSSAPAILVYVRPGATLRDRPALIEGFRVAYRESDPPRAFHWKQQSELPAPASSMCVRRTSN